MKLLILSKEDIRRALPMKDAIEAMKRAFLGVSNGQAQVPHRLALSSAKGVTLIKPALIPSVGLGTKLVSVFSKNREKGLPTTLGIMVMLDPQTGAPTMLCDGTFLTAWRTGAASGAASDLLARPDAQGAALFGCGAQAKTQALAIDAARALLTIKVYARSPDAVRAFIKEMQPELRARLIAADTPKEALKDAEIICTATTSATPVFDGAQLSEGAHINGVGSFTPDARELDETTITRARIFVDSRSSALQEAGDLLMPMNAGHIGAEDWTELGEVVAQTKPGRVHNAELTVFKSVGVAAQDVEASAAALARGSLGWVERSRFERPRHHLGQKLVSITGA